MIVFAKQPSTTGQGTPLQSPELDPVEGEVILSDGCLAQKVTWTGLVIKPKGLKDLILCVGKSAQLMACFYYQGHLRKKTILLGSDLERRTYHNS